VGSEFDHEV